MPNINTANFALTGMTTKRTLATRLGDQWLSVKDFGATGDGTTSDHVAIQLAINTLFGSPGSPQGDAGSTVTSKMLYFPAGNYKISQPLTLNRAYGLTLVGAGSMQTRIFWSGAEVKGEADFQEPSFIGPPISSLIEAKDCWHVHVQGITLDASHVQQVVWRMMRYGDRLPNGWHQSGSDGYFRDVTFTNAALNGVWAAGEALSSEQTFIGCSFTNCTQYGHVLGHQNALNHSFYNCYFANNGVAMYQIGGGGGAVLGCQFVNNATWDISYTELSLIISNCTSTSTNFASVDGIIISCSHTGNGIFWTRHAPGTATGMMICKGNYSTSSYFDSANEDSSLYLIGNDFLNANYLNTFIGDTLWVDWTMVREP